jgi:hypothetical protein
VYYSLAYRVVSELLWPTLTIWQKRDLISRQMTRYILTYSQSNQPPLHMLLYALGEIDLLQYVLAAVDVNNIGLHTAYTNPRNYHLIRKPIISNSDQVDFW